MGLTAELRRLLGDEQVLAPAPQRYLVDATEARGLRGEAKAVVLPRSADEVAGLVEYCYEREVPVVPRGGGTGYAGGAVPSGGIVLALERLARFRSFDPFRWRMCAEAAWPESSRPPPSPRFPSSSSGRRGTPRRTRTPTWSAWGA